MSLRQPHLVILKSVIQRVRQNAGDRTLKCLILGYPDILLPRAGIESVFGNLPDSAFRPHPAPDKLPAWAAEAGGDRSLVDTDGLLQALGLSVDYVDLYRHRGPERLVDLNEPLAEDFTGAYDMVFDIGTIEHVFNIGTAFMSLAGAVRVGGFIAHFNPLSRCNHGFWNLSPTAYVDFYQANGFMVHRILGFPRKGEGGKIFNLPPHQRISPPEGTLIVAIVQKTQDQALAWPVQTKYQAPDQPDRR